MIKEALEYIIGLRDTEKLIIDGDTYIKDSYRKIQEPEFYKDMDLAVSSLSGMVAYIRNDCDGSNDYNLIVEIRDNKDVFLRGETCHADGYRRNDYIRAQADLPRIILNQYMQMESFIVQMQTCFDRDQGDWADLVTLASNIRLTDEVKTSDDGISQNVTAKTGVARVAEVRLPNPMQLAPIRTFQELQQPLSPFVFRIDQNGQLGLFEADGGAWKYTARERIKEYLETALGDLDGLTILA